MRLSWNEVRARAAAFAHDWREAAYEKGETQSFYNELFANPVLCESMERVSVYASQFSSKAERSRRSPTRISDNPA